MKRQKNGITLIALVVTIIVLLILAGVAISLTIGNNGLFTRAENAANTWRKAETNEQEEMKNFEGLYDETVKNLGLNGNGNGEGSKKPIGEITGNETEKTETTDKEGTRIIVPAGFKVINPEATVNEGIVIEDVSANNSDTVGNQFVWIPCEIETEENKSNGKLKYDRYAFTRDDWDLRQIKLTEKDEDESYKVQLVKDTPYYFHEVLSEDEKTSIETYGGFYIGRYEVGCNIERIEHTPTTEIAKVKRGLKPYNYVTRDEAKQIAEDMYSGKSKLCSSYAWDTALKFIDEESRAYAVNSVGDNYSSDLKNTGHYGIKNVYDMGGNVGEWTTENSTYPNGLYVLRGGSYVGGALYSPAGCRYYYNVDINYNRFGFRSTLYM